MAKSYYVRVINGAAQGPFAVAQLDRYIEQGRVRQDMEFSEDGETWLSGASLPALFPPPTPIQTQASAPAPSRRRSASPAPARSKRGAKGGVPKDSAPDTRRERRSQVPENDEARHALNQAISTAHRNLKAVRSLLIVDAVLVGLVLLVALAGDSTAFKLIMAGLLAAVVASAIFVVRFPVPCTVALALFHTVVAAPFALFGPGGVNGILMIVLAFASWSTVRMASKLNSLLKRYPDALAAKRLRGESLGSGERGTRWQERAQEQGRAKRKRLALMIGGAVLLGIGALLVSTMSNDEPPFERSELPADPIPTRPLGGEVHAFQAAWDGQTLDDILAKFAPRLREGKRSPTHKLLRRRKWLEERPPITVERREVVALHQVSVFWTIEGEEKVMQTNWQWEDDAWWLVRMTLRIRR